MRYYIKIIENDAKTTGLPQTPFRHGTVYHIII